MAVIDGVVSDLCAKLDAAEATIKLYQAQARRRAYSAGDVAAPTWTSGDGRTQRLTDMATTHLENILGILFSHGLTGGHGGGIYIAIKSELRLRQNEGFKPCSARTAR